MEIEQIVRNPRFRRSVLQVESRKGQLLCNRLSALICLTSYNAEGVATSCSIKDGLDSQTNKWLHDFAKHDPDDKDGIDLDISVFGMFRYDRSKVEWTDWSQKERLDRSGSEITTEIFVWGMLSNGCWIKGVITVVLLSVGGDRVREFVEKIELSFTAPCKLILDIPSLTVHLFLDQLGIWAEATRKEASAVEAAATIMVADLERLRTEPIRVLIVGVSATVRPIREACTVLEETFGCSIIRRVIQKKLDSPDPRFAVDCFAFCMRYSCEVIVILGAPNPAEIDALFQQLDTEEGAPLYFHLALSEAP